MKKSLFAIAAVTAFAGAAQAQSSVTVYGIIDMGFASTSSRVGANKATNAGFIQAGNGSQTSSRLGFRGNEDLGGGLSAFFTIETELAGMTTDTVNGNRQTFVGLGKKGIGRAAIGTQYTVMHDAVAATDPGESNNVIGSVIRPMGYANSAGGQLNILGNNAAGGNHMIRATNMIKFNSDKFAGFGINAAYIQANGNSTQSNTGTAAGGGSFGGTANFFGYNIGADYRWQKLFVTAAYGTVKQEQNGLGGTVRTGGTNNPPAGTVYNTANTTTGTTNLAFPATITAGVNPNTTTSNMYVGGIYDFGVLKAYAAYSNAKIDSGYDSNLFIKRSAQQLGVRGNFTPKIQSWASVGSGRATTYGTNQPTANFNAWQLGTSYILSKRTNLYAIYGQSVTSSSATVPGGAAGSQYALGARHTF
jgi:predicted porin